MSYNFYCKHDIKLFNEYSNIIVFFVGVVKMSQMGYSYLTVFGAWKILIWRNFGHLRRKFGQFLTKIDCFESFDLQLPNAAINLPNFLMWELFLWSSLRKSYSICLENSDLAKFWPFKTKIWPVFDQN